MLLNSIIPSTSQPQLQLQKPATTTTIGKKLSKEHQDGKNEHLATLQKVKEHLTTLIVNRFLGAL